MNEWMAPGAVLAMLAIALGQWAQYRSGRRKDEERVDDLEREIAAMKTNIAVIERGDRERQKFEEGMERATTNIWASIEKLRDRSGK